MVPIVPGRVPVPRLPPDLCRVSEITVIRLRQYALPRAEPRRKDRYTFSSIFLREVRPAVEGQRHEGVPSFSGHQVQRLGSLGLIGEEGEE